MIAAAELAERIGYPTPWWPGRCYKVVLLALSSGSVEGIFEYGECLNHDHAWVRCGTTIVDPTRWALVGGRPTVDVIELGDSRYEDYCTWGTVEADTPVTDVPVHIMEVLLGD